MTVSPLLEYWGIRHTDTIKQIETELAKLSAANEEAMPQYDKTAGNNIKTYRLLSGKSVAAFSEELNIYPPLLRMIEAGHCTDRPLIDHIGEVCGFKHIGHLCNIYLRLLLGKYKLSENSRDCYIDMSLLSLYVLLPNDTTNVPCRSLLQLDKEAFLHCLTPYRSSWDNSAKQIRKNIGEICLQQNYPFGFKISRNLAFLRQGKKASLETMAKETGIPAPVIEKAESEQEDLTLEQLAAICTYLEVPEPAAMFYNGYALFKLCQDRKLMQKATWAFEYCLYSKNDGFGRIVLPAERRSDKEESLAGQKGLEKL